MIEAKMYLHIIHEDILDEISKIIKYLITKQLTVLFQMDHHYLNYSMQVLGKNHLIHAK